ncbi:retrotransposon protein [Cucumis melo var. makuwa]|uniref:Retrotransposon protein n=1 Tax=Cucumis melo var. makuwa TaxID=1194695 RepID=A0A5D3C398_CUCMM|nr:retrotransposon protein [Cucumis melo var. makuwa]
MDPRWKCFVNYLGTFDGMYINVNVPAIDRPTSRTRKGKIATNVLDMCDIKGDFVYVLASWEGSAADSSILRDALARPNGLQVPKVYPNAEEFLAPHKGQRYHLQEWHGAENALITIKEYFNMKHSFARNVIKYVFDLLNGHWTILREKSYYLLQVQCRTIITCCLLHNLINREMTNDEDIDDVDEGDSARDRAMGHFAETFTYVESNEFVEYDGWKQYGASIHVGEIEMIHMALKCTNDQMRSNAEWPVHTLANDTAVRQEFLWLLREMPNLSCLDRAMCQRLLMRSMDDMRGFIEMTNK